jgi:RNA polymerase sigma factor (sigma-70 family)
MRVATRARDELATLFGIGAVGRLSDAELLARFIRREDADSSEAAFSALMSRHGPMVLGTCRRMLGDDHAAADAFQAVFLVLARKAPAVRVDDSLGRWLHGVSVRVARRARAIARAHQARVQALDGFDPPDASSPGDPGVPNDLRAAIDEEIARLPARYRSAVVLCYLEGLTQEQAARRLRCPLGTVQSRLHRARERLRPALARRGLAPAAWSLATLAATTARAQVPPALVAATAAAAHSWGGTLAGMVPAAVARLTRSTMRSMLMFKSLQFGFMLVALGWSAAGAVLLAGGDGRKEAAPIPAPAPEIVGVTTRPEPVLAQPADPPQPKRKDTNARLKPKYAELTTSVEPSRAKPGDTIMLKVTAKIDHGYHIYKYIKTSTKPVEGPVYTSFDLFDTDGLEVQGDWSASKEPARCKEANWPDLPFVEYHEDEVTWSIKLKVPPDTPAGKKTLRVQVGYMICSDKTCSVPGRWTLPDAALKVLAAD